MDDQKTIQRKTVFSLIMSITAIVLLTSIHHVYGAIHYKTPWRLHTLHINIPGLIFITVILLYSLKDYEQRLKLRRISVFMVFIIWLLWLGLFEGIYNHLFKDILYFSGTPLAVMRMLFPPPTYDLPNDLIFEVTGILQILPLWSIWKNSREVWKKTSQ